MNRMEHSEIHEIICKSKKRDTHAFRHLVEHYQAYAYSLAFRVVYHEEEAEDIVQESFLKVWANIHTYRNEMKFSTWLYRIVVNLSLDKLRKRKLHPGK